MKIRPSFLWLGALGLAAVLACSIMALLMSQTTVPLASGTWLSPARPLAPFTLTDTAGQPYTEQQLLGHPSLVFLVLPTAPTSARRRSPRWPRCCAAGRWRDCR